MASSLPNDWIETGLKVTGHFEDSDDPLGAVSDDFDGQGISLGVLQWNIGQGSLQPLVRSVGEAKVVAGLPTLGAEFWMACNAPVNKGLAIVRGWQPGGQMPKPVARELRAFTAGPDFVAQQIAAARKVADRAYQAAGTYAAADPAFLGTVSKRLFCWFFDLQTQNGGLGALTYDDVSTFLAGRPPAQVIGQICDWLAARTDPQDAAAADSHRNASLWRPMALPPPAFSLLVLSYLRAQQAKKKYRGLTLNRKGTIAVATGWVNAEQHDLATLLNLTVPLISNNAS